MQAKIVVDDSEAEEVVMIWRSVPSRGQNHMVYDFNRRWSRSRASRYDTLEREDCVLVTLQREVGVGIKSGLGFELCCPKRPGYY